MPAPTAQLPLPTHLQHKPVFAMPFFNHDPHREGGTDCHHLSVGWSQWDGREASAKAIRYGEQKWSRQAEELPLGRLADLLSLVVMADLNGGGDTITVPADFFEKQPQPITLHRQGGRPTDKGQFREALADEVFQRRLDRLTDLLVQRRQARGTP